MIDAYIALGGNLVGTLQVMQQIVTRLKGMQGIDKLISSRLYKTSPVSSIAQPDYINAVCRFQTNLTLENLWQTLQNLELEMGKKSKPKENPRLIDIDLLFYGEQVLVSHDLILPHPRWKERLFVLTPLADLTDIAPTGGQIKEIMEGFCNPHQEKISLMKKRLLT